MNSTLSSRGFTRRALLQGLAMAGVCTALPTRLWSQSDAAWTDRLFEFLAGCARADGGYAWPDEPDSHLSNTFAVIGCHVLFKREPPNKTALAEYVRENHPAKRSRPESPLHFFEWQQIQALRWLGADVSTFIAEVKQRKTPLRYPVAYEQSQWPILQMEATAFTCRELLGLPLTDLAPELIAYLESRRRENGSFNNAPASAGGDGHVLNTWWAVQALRALGRGHEQADSTVAWVRACQLPNGGFTYQPKPTMGGIDDVAYTWAAVRLLNHYHALPANRSGCVAYLHSLRNADGGFADRPGWMSNPVASFYAVDALQALGALEEPPPAAIKPRAHPHAPLTNDLKVFTIQVEAPGTGSPTEAVELARALHIHLWGAKNSAPGWIARAQAIADARQVPVKFFRANEEYGTWVRIPGLGTYSHTSDVMAPAEGEIGPPLTDAGPVSWEEFRRRRLEPLERAGGRLFWQFGENEELTRLYLDDSIERGGYAAISTFHFGNPDFLISEPFLHRYRGQLSFIALQDAHGPESWWWGDMLEGFRTLFLGTEATWAAWRRALENDWVMAVRRDAVNDFQMRLHGGAPGVPEYVRAHADEWQWWNSPRFARPLASIVVVRPEDPFELGRPARGVALRVRCQWENTKQGQPKNPRVELVSLRVDGQSVTPEFVQRKAAKGAVWSEVHHRIDLPDLAPGRHRVVAAVRELKTNQSSTLTHDFNLTKP
jgi:hypothetical protein